MHEFTKKSLIFNFKLALPFSKGLVNRALQNLANQKTTILKVINTIPEYNQWLSTIDAHAQIGFVPTMGALHYGHLTLVKQSVAENQFTVCSIYVNPTQFDNPEDLLKYPKSLKTDIDLLKNTGCDVLFAPDNMQMYPAGEDLSKYKFDFSPIDRVLEGKHRKGHFEGVGIIVGKLFNIIKPARAYFGEKDYQQLQVVKRLSQLMKVDTKVIGVPIVRETDGLAMSSRNLRLSSEERKNATFIYKILIEAKKQYGQNQELEYIEKHVINKFQEHALFKLDYFEIVDENSLLANGDQTNWRCFVAAFIGPVRLIDNMSLIA